MVALVDASGDALAALSEALASGDSVLLVAGLVVLGVVLIMKLLRKRVPLLDPVLSGALKVLRSVRRRPSEVPADQATAEGVAAVVKIEDLKK